MLNSSTSLPPPHPTARLLRGTNYSAHTATYRSSDVVSTVYVKQPCLLAIAAIIACGATALYGARFRLSAVSSAVDGMRGCTMPNCPNRANQRRPRKPHG